jgi:acylphosphatase
MKKCLKITLKVPQKKEALFGALAKHAQSLSVEGTVQSGSDLVRVIACGIKDRVDDFVDVIHREAAKVSAEDVVIEPYLKDKDYRGVFRIIE